jgi:hypothetical protein
LGHYESGLREPPEAPLYSIGRTHPPHSLHRQPTDESGVSAIRLGFLVAATLPTPFVTILFSSVRTAVARPFLRGAITLEMGQG